MSRVEKSNRCKDGFNLEKKCNNNIKEEKPQWWYDIPSTIEKELAE